MSFYFYDQILSFRFKLLTIALMGIHLMHIYCVCTAADILLWYWHSFSSVWTAALKLCTILRPELNFFKQIHNQETITAVNHCEQDNDCIVVCYWFFFYDFKSMFSSFGMLLVRKARRGQCCVKKEVCEQQTNSVLFTVHGCNGWDWKSLYNTFQQSYCVLGLFTLFPSLLVWVTSPEFYTGKQRIAKWPSEL